MRSDKEASILTFRWQQCDKVIGEDSNLSPQFTLPPALVRQLAAQNRYNIALHQLQLILVQRIVRVKHFALLAHWFRRQNRSVTVADEILAGVRQTRTVVVYFILNNCGVDIVTFAVGGDRRCGVDELDEVRGEDADFAAELPSPPSVFNLEVKCWLSSVVSSIKALTHLLENLNQIPNGKRQFVVFAFFVTVDDLTPSIFRQWFVSVRGRNN